MDEKEEAKEEARKAVNEGLSDQRTMQQLSSSGLAAQAARKNMARTEDKKTKDENDKDKGGTEEEKLGMLQLLRGKISLEEALDADRDIIHQLSYPEKRFEFWVYLYEHRSQIAQVVSRHLNIPEHDFTIGEVKEWIHGSYNVCLPICINNRCHSTLPKRAIIRFPLPYKTGEAFRPGNVEEKLRCEAATYMWLQTNCASVPIPRLFGVGFPGTRSLTLLEHESAWNRVVWHLRRALLWFSGSALPPYCAHRRQGLIEVGYLLIEHIDKGSMLSESWDEHSHDPSRRANLFCDLARTMLCLAKLPLPRIGSWTVDDQGVLSLTNRPLTLLLHEMENHQIPTEIPRDLTYTAVEPYLLDLIDCHNNRMRFQPNSIHDGEDGERQLAALAGMRSLLPQLIDRRAQGPYILTFTDLHKSNIFVDEDWRITSIIDLEWACTLPVQMLSVPHWLTNRGVGGLTGPHLDEYATMYSEFADALRKEEVAGKHSSLCSQALKDLWETGRLWYVFALNCPEALSAVFSQHIQPRFGLSSSESQTTLMRLWDKDAPGFISSKIAEQRQYDAQLREMFDATGDVETKDIHRDGK